MSENNAGDGEPVITGEMPPENTPDTTTADTGAASEAVSGASGAAETPASREGKTEEAAPAPTAGEEPTQAPKRPKALQNRFDELTRARYEADRAREEAEARASTAEEMLRKLANGEKVEAPTTTEATNAPGTDAFRKAVEQEARRVAAAAEFNGRANAIFDAGTKAYPDFADKVADLRMVGAIRADDPTFLTAAMATDAPEKVLHHLGSDPDEAVRIAALPTVQMAAELVKLAIRLDRPKTPTVSSAPAPITPLAGTATKDFDPADDDVPVDQWIAEMDRRDAARRAADIAR